MTYPAQTFEEAVDLSVAASNQIHQIVNGSATEEVIVEDGSTIPTVRKAYADNLFFKSPIPWEETAYESVFNQLRAFEETGGNISWWYAPNATVSSPVLMTSDPKLDSNWVLYTTDHATIIEIYKRLMLESGYNYVGNFKEGCTVTSSKQGVLDTSTGKWYSWDGTLNKIVYPNSTPTPIGVGGWIDQSTTDLRGELESAGATIAEIASLKSDLNLFKEGLAVGVTDESTTGEIVSQVRVNLSAFGNVNAPATWVAAIGFCASKGYVLSVDAPVALTDIAKYIMADGTRVVIDWTNCPSFSVLDTGDWEKLVITSEKYALQDNCHVEFIGTPKIIGTGVAYWGESNTGMQKNIPVRIQANTVKIEGYDVRSVWGFGLRIFNARNVEIKSFNAEEVGGHSTTYVPDDFGDGIYFGGLTGDVHISIGLRRITGMLGAEGSSVSKGLSRGGIVFENATSVGSGEVRLHLRGGDISNFERNIHAEGIGNLTVTWTDSPVVKNAGVLLHRYNPVGAEGKVTYATIDDMEYHQKENHRFEADYGIGGGCYATLNGGVFYGLGKPFDIDSNVNQTPSAANWTFNGADIYLNNSRLQFRLGSCSVNGGRIFDHGVQQQNADGSKVTFKSVNFDTILSALNGAQVSPSGKDAFIGCILNNQTFARTNAFDACVFRNDKGISTSGGTRVTSYTQKIPKIPLSIYRITVVDTGVEYVNIIYENGTIIGGKLTDNGDGTVSLHSSVPLHAVVTIQWFK